MASIDELLASARTDTEKIDRLVFMLKNRDLVISEQEEHIRRLTADQERADREAYNAQHIRIEAARLAASLAEHLDTSIFDAAVAFEHYMTTGEVDPSWLLDGWVDPRAPKPTTKEGPTA